LSPLSNIYLLVKNNIDLPKAKKISKLLEKHGDIREDNYFWMNERDTPDVLDD